MHRATIGDIADLPAEQRLSDWLGIKEYVVPVRSSGASIDLCFLLLPPATTLSPTGLSAGLSAELEGTLLMSVTATTLAQPLC
jgi:hypothetical protein